MDIALDVEQLSLLFLTMSVIGLLQVLRFLAGKELLFKGFKVL